MSAEEEGTEVGAKFTKAFIDAAAAGEAVDNWAGEFPVVKVVMGDCAWFKPFMASLAS